MCIGADRVDKAEFDRLFDDFVTAPLERASFKQSGKSLISHDNLRTVALIRIGGRMASPGCVSHILCFRHSFLRDFNEVRPNKPPTEPNEYPYRFQPSVLQSIDAALWRYTPHSGSYSYDTFEWAASDTKQTHFWLGDLADFIVNRFVPWTQVVTPQRALDHLLQDGEQNWSERLWIEDYTKHLAR